MKELKNAGTLAYLSPEVLKNEFWTSKTDIWSFGCVLYELCCYRHPFVGTNETSLAAKIMYEKPVPIPETYSRDLWGIIQFCLTKDPNQRPSAYELLSMPGIFLIFSEKKIVIIKKASELGLLLMQTQPPSPVKLDDKPINSPKKKVQFGHAELLDQITISRPKAILPPRIPKDIAIKSILKTNRKFRATPLKVGVLYSEEDKDNTQNKSMIIANDKSPIELKPVLTMSGAAAVGSIIVKPRKPRQVISRNTSENCASKTRPSVAFKAVNRIGEKVMSNNDISLSNISNKNIQEKIQISRPELIPKKDQIAPIKTRWNMHHHHIVHTPSSENRRNLTTDPVNTIMNQDNSSYQSAGPKMRSYKTKLIHTNEQRTIMMNPMTNRTITNFGCYADLKNKNELPIIWRSKAASNLLSHK